MNRVERIDNFLLHELASCDRSNALALMRKRIVAAFARGRVPCVFRTRMRGGHGSHGGVGLDRKNGDLEYLSRVAEIAKQRKRKKRKKRKKKNLNK